jgi:hypothetical protein
MNIQKIYSDSIGRVAKEDLESASISPAEDASRFQARMSWLESTITQEIFKEVRDEITSLESKARDLACSYPVHQNHQQIINALVRAEELRKVVTKYASAK